MRNLISEGFSRLFRSKSFFVCLIIIIAFPIFFMSLEKLIMGDAYDMIDEATMDETVRDYQMELYNTMMFMVSMIPLFIVIAAGIFIISDFTQNTIRNKIIYGHSRTNIYLSNLIITSCVTVVYHIAAMTVTGIIANILFDVNNELTKVNVYYILLSFIVLLGTNAFTVMLCMIMKRTFGAVLSYLIYDLSGILIGLASIMENKKLMMFIIDVLPQSQLAMISSGNSLPDGVHKYLVPLYAAAIIVISTAFGILHFRKSDVK